MRILNLSHFSLLSSLIALSAAEKPNIVKNLKPDRSAGAWQVLFDGKNAEWLDRKTQRKFF